MKRIIGITLIIIGMILGLYVGFWHMFIGGIMCIARIIDSGDITAVAIALNVIKILFAGFIGWLVFIIFLITGRVFL